MAELIRAGGDEVDVRLTPEDVDLLIFSARMVREDLDQCESVREDAWELLSFFKGVRRELKLL